MVKVGFTSSWRYDEEGKARVAQVDRPTPQNGTAALDAQRGQFESKGVRVKDGSWGYRLCPSVCERFG